MKRLHRSVRWVLIALATALCVAVWHQRPIPIIPTVYAAAMGAQDQTDQAPPPDQGQDPAAGNLAPSGPSYTTQAPPPRRPVGRSGSGSRRIR